jgi:hypothetical protein
MSGSFSPTSLSGLGAWYDFGDLSTLWQDTARTSAVTADAQSIKGVTDKSGNGNHLSEATNPPTYKAAIQNGRSVSRFDGTNDTLLAANHASISLEGDSTVFIVTKPVVGVGLMSLLAKSNDANPAALYIALDTSISNGRIRVDRPFIEAGVHHGDALSGSVFQIVEVRLSGTTQDHHIDGAYQGKDTLAAGTAVNNSMRIGTFASGALNPYPGDIAEILVYNTALSHANIIRVNQYLAAKWGLTLRVEEAPPISTPTVFWYDFSDTKTMFQEVSWLSTVTADGNVIQAIVDKGERFNLIKTGTQPIYKTSIQNGRGVGRFASGGVKNVVGEDIWTPTGVEKNFTLFVVGKMTSNLANFGRFVTIGAAADYEMFINTGDNQLGWFRTDGPGNLSLTGVDSGSAFFVASIRNTNGPEVKGYVNGVLKFTADPVPNTLPGFLYLGTSSTNEVIDGDIGEVMLFENVLSAADHNTVGQYLANKWGTTWTTVT